MNGRLDRAQARYDAEEPPDSEHKHVWRCIGESRDGTRFFKCRICGDEYDD